MRRAGAAKREVLPDPKYGSRLVAKFVNIMMICGKKSTAEQIMYAALVSVEDRSKQDALKMFKSAIDNVKSPSTMRLSFLSSSSSIRAALSYSLVVLGLASSNSVSPCRTARGVFNSCEASETN